MSIPKVSIRQIKAARSLIGWSQNDLAERSGVSIATVKRLESAEGELGGRDETSERLRKALEAAGIEFTNGGQPGVRLAAYKVRVAKRGKVDGVILERGVSGKPEWFSHEAAQEEALRARRAGDPRLADALSLISQAPPATILPEDEPGPRDAEEFAREMADHAIDKALQNSAEPGHVKDKRRRALTEMPPGAKGKRPK